MARLPTGPYKTGRTGCYGCIRSTTADGGCGVHGYPCVHYGIDLFATSPEVVAPETGVVIAVSNGSTAPFAGYNPGVVLIQGVSGYFHLLGHLDFKTITVVPGMSVLEGQKLGTFNREMGHTHWEVRRQMTGPSETNTVNPLLWFKSQERKLVATSESTRPSAKKVLTVIAIGVGFVGASWLALRIAKAAATAKSVPRHAPRPAT